VYAALLTQVERHLATARELSRKAETVYGYGSPQLRAADLVVMRFVKLRNYIRERQEA
jgi:hypothetical protein